MLKILCQSFLTLTSPPLSVGALEIVLLLTIILSQKFWAR